MASWLVLDWDQDQFHVLAAQTSRRGVTVTRAITWAHPEPFTPSTADRVGKALREFLNAEKIANAPVIVGLGRDRVFLKELRFPAVAGHEEAGLVRFQTGKEMAEGVDNYAIDYAYLDGSAGNDRQVMTVAGRRDIVAMIQTLCQSAGLKLQGITPKLFGVTYALERAIQPDPSPLKPKQLNVVLTVGQRWAELCFFRGERLVQSQALANGPLLVSEVKRNLAVFQAQHAVDLNLQGPDCLYVFGDDAAVLQNLQAGQALPLHILDPLRQGPAVAAAVKSPAYFAGAVGLASLWAQSVQQPINLATPKRQTPPSNVNRRNALIYGAAALAVVVVLAIMIFTHMQKRSEIARLTREKIESDNFLAKNAQERAEVDYYKEWERSTVPWLDEFYDLAARNPFKEEFRVKDLQAISIASTAPKKGAAKDATPIGKIILTGVDPTKKGEYLTALLEAMGGDAHITPRVSTTKADAKGANEYLMEILISKQDAKKYTTQLIVPPPRGRQPSAKNKAEPIPPPAEEKDAEKKDAEPNPDDAGGNNE